ncbi:MAG TPA: glycosyltransferase [Bacteroidia bacterium]|nr:glycosyltransferase [Bacteroidia bacterium]HNT80712.1 glycosyltransferase [Bacteroidia bacterium]
MARIVIIGPAYPLRGGIANLNETLAIKLIQKNHTVDLVSFYFQYPSLLFPGTSQTENTQTKPDLNIHNLISSINPLSWIRTAQKVNRLKPDIVIFRYWLPFMGPCLGSIARLLKCKYKVAIADNIIPHEKRLGDGIFTKWFCKSMSGFVVMSKSVLNDLSQFTNSSTKVYSPHPIYDMYGSKIEKGVARKKLNLDPNDRVILFFGFIRKYKGLMLLLKAMARPEIADLNIKLLVAGEFYDDTDEYMSFIQENNLSDRVILHSHFIPREDIALYFSASDIVVQPYLSATQSGVTQIAYHFDKAMLVTHVGGLSEIVSHNKNGYVVDVNEDAVSGALIDFYTKQREIPFSEESKLLKKQYEWDYFIDNIFKVSALK